MKSKISLTMVLLVALMSSPMSTSADLVVTEVMSSSNFATGDDWWELTNNGPTSINLAGYYWDDDGATGDDGAIFGNVTIGSCESIIILEGNATAADFIANWGLAASVQVLDEDSFTGPDTFSGLSSGGDQVELWDEDPNLNPFANLVSSAVFGTATGGVSFEWSKTGDDLGLSSDGVNGAFSATDGINTDIGSPGSAVPEPGSMGVLALIGLSVALRRRK